MLWIFKKLVNYIWLNIINLYLQGARIALNAQYRSLHLPSVVQFLIVFDNIIKEWRFNTEAS